MENRIFKKYFVYMWLVFSVLFTSALPDIAISEKLTAQQWQSENKYTAGRISHVKYTITAADGGPVVLLVETNYSANSKLFITPKLSVKNGWCKIVFLSDNKPVITLDSKKGNPVSGEGIVVTDTGGNIAYRITAKDVSDMSLEFDISRSNKTEIQKVQTQLIELGYNPGKTDGLLGEKTKEAIKNFQRDNVLKATGKLNKQTKEKLKIATEKGAKNKATNDKQIFAPSASIYEGQFIIENEPKFENNGSVESGRIVIIFSKDKKHVKKIAIQPKKVAFTDGSKQYTINSMSECIKIKDDSINIGNGHFRVADIIEGKITSMNTMEGIVYLKHTDPNNKTIEIGTWDWKANAYPKKTEATINNIGCD